MNLFFVFCNLKNGHSQERKIKFRNFQSFFSDWGNILSSYSLSICIIISLQNKLSLTFITSYQHSISISFSHCSFIYQNNTKQQWIVKISRSGQNSETISRATRNYQIKQSVILMHHLFYYGQLLCKEYVFIIKMHLKTKTMHIQNLNTQLHKSVKSLHFHSDRFHPCTFAAKSI